MKNIIKSILRPIKIFLLTFFASIISFLNKKINKDFKCNAKTKRCIENIKSPSFRYELRGENIPICCATHLYELIRDVTSILEKNNMEYFICCGTLLGAVRHRGLIPWDTDIDMVIPDNKKDEIFNILVKNLGNKYIVKHEKEKGFGNLIRVFYSSLNTTHIDLFTYFSFNETIKVFKEERIFNKVDIFPLQKIKFYDIELFAPKKYELHLQRLYGNEYMRYAYKQWALNKNKFKITDYSPARVEK